MGLHFGELAKIRGIVFYKLSQHEQKPFANAFRYGIPNVFRRWSDTVLRMWPPLIIGYFVYEAVEAAHHANTRKNPKDFLFEEEPVA